MREILKSGETVELFKQLVPSFYCKNNLDVQDYLCAGRAIEHEQRGKSRTYLCLFGKRIVGYFTLTLLSIDLSGLSSSQVKKLNGYEAAENCAIYVIGQLGKADGCEYEGSFLLKTALEYIRAASEFVGGRAAMVECDNISNLVEFYTHNGFSRITTSARGKLRFVTRISME